MGCTVDAQRSEPLLETVEQETGPAPEWSVLWLHGLGADGHDFAPIVPELVRRDWPALRFVFPHAPVRAVTINNGVRMRAWYDIRDMNLANRADEAGRGRIGRAGRGADRARGRARHSRRHGCCWRASRRAGRSRWPPRCARRSRWPGWSRCRPICRWPSAWCRKPPRAPHAQPVFMAHGQFDPVVPYAGGDFSAQQLRALGFNVDWHALPDGAPGLCGGNPRPRRLDGSALRRWPEHTGLSVIRTWPATRANPGSRTCAGCRVWR